jgi:UDP-2-acetamido-3-amino-2,3-dideoxy-glucuronate N-acetyltransferase
MVKVALIGCGGWGKNLARNLYELGALAAIVDPSPAAEALAKQFGVRHEADSKAILTDPVIKAVAIASPASTHAAVVSDALNAGKDVFVEKPIALKIEDAAALATLAASKGLILMVGHLLQYHAVYLKLKELARSGSLGHIRHITSSRLNLGLIRSEENVVWSFAPHDISMVLAIAGGLPNRISAVGTTVLQEGIPDIATVHMEFAGGLKADVTVSWLHPQKEQNLIVVGDDGMAVFSDTKPWAEKLSIHRNKVTWGENRPKAAAGPRDLIEVPQAEPLKEEMRHFLECVDLRKAPRTGPEEAIPVLTALQAAQASLDRKGAWIAPEDLAPARLLHQGVDIHPTAAVDDGCVLGHGTRVWHFAHVLKGSRLGERCVVGQNVMIGPDVTIGNGCKIQNNVAVYKGVTLEDDVFCGPSMVFTNVLTPRAHVERKSEFALTRIGKGATLGANCTIVCGHDVGEYAMVGAGAVVTKQVAPYALVLGNPAKQLGWVSRAGERLGPDLVCPRTGEVYELKDGKLSPAL